LDHAIVLTKWKQQARKLKREVCVLSLAVKDPRVPWYAKALALGVIGYPFSPIDLIPDPIPVLGYLDDLIVVPLGVVLVLKLIPRPVLTENREQAELALAQGKPTNWVAAGVIVAIWIVVLVAAILWLRGVIA
jgi:uncharacterized membrane protein YkvA (DUF1232 family)